VSTSTSSSSNDLSGDGACTITAEAIAALVGGELVGDGRAVVTGVAPLDRAGEHDLSFLGSGKYSALFARSRAGVVLVDPELRDAPGGARARVIVTKPMEKMLTVLPKLYRQKVVLPGVAPTARIGSGATLGERVSIGDYAVIAAGARIGDDTVVDPHAVVGEGARVGASCHLHSHSTIYAQATLGDRVVIHSGVRIGSDGFGYVFRDGAHNKIPHVGGCVIGDDVEIGANTTIDRGSIGDTVIGAGTKIDNLVQIGHNVRIGKLCLLMAQVGVAGSVIVEDGCIIAGQAGLAGHLTVGAGARIAARAGVFGNVPAGETWSGYPARPHRESLRASAALLKLADLMRRIEKLLEEHPAR
jgi:UDP-3-O-[3-hydroxymyristoyl] glucosamine N-acyltransferase